MFAFLLGVIYLSFISLGLPDSLLGAAWPVIRQELGAPLSWSGVVFMIISAGTITSSLLSDRMTKRFGPGQVTAFSVAATCAALFGFSFSHSFAALCLWAIPYGLGAGGVDAALNNYVAIHYASRHMSWLHCMWGIGASLGPYIMGTALTAGKTWQYGYRTIGFFQLILTAIILLSLPMWRGAVEGTGKSGKALPMPEVAAVPGVREAMLCFFCYCALEQSAGLWASSYLVSCRGMDTVTAARSGSLFFLGITGGRAISGFLTIRYNDRQMVRLGLCIIVMGLSMFLLPGTATAVSGLILVGLGCAPVYPSLIHAAPSSFGSDRSQAVIGLQMACAYVGTMLMPPFFGILAGRLGIHLLPVWMAVLVTLLFWMHERMLKRVRSLSEQRADNL